MTWTCSQAVARNRSKNFATLDSTINAWDRREIAWAKRERQQQRARRQAGQSAAIDTFSADLREAMDGAREMDAALLVYRQAATKMTAAEEKSFTRLADAITLSNSAAFMRPSSLIDELAAIRPPRPLAAGVLHHFSQHEYAIANWYADAAKFAVEHLRSLPTTGTDDDESEAA